MSTLTHWAGGILRFWPKMETSSSQHRRQKKERDSSNLVTLCKILKTVHILDHCKGHGDSLDLYCHGSLRYQDTTTVVDGSGTDTGASKLGLVCQDGKFVSVKDQAAFSVEEATCSRKQEPRLVRNQNGCSAVGADGRKDGEEKRFIRWIHS